MDWLDKDGGGEVELDELEEFWNEVKVKHDEDYDDYVEPGQEAELDLAGESAGESAGELSNDADAVLAAA